MAENAAKNATSSQVWKYELATTDQQTIEMPEGAELLHIAPQYGNLQLWARVIPGHRLVPRRVLVRGTGHSILNEPYIGTAVTNSGSLVWHIFDGGEVTPSANE